LDVLSLLKEHDDPVYWEHPPGFDYRIEQERLLSFVDEFAKALKITPKVETGICIQDASFHSQIIFAVGFARFHSLRFSNFGSFITISDDEDVPDEMLVSIKQLAENYGYTYIPCQLLDANYTGNNPGVTGIDTWWIRFFDYV